MVRNWRTFCPHEPKVRGFLTEQGSFSPGEKDLAEENLTGREPHRERTSQGENLTGREPHRERTSQGENLTGREPHRERTSQVVSLFQGEVSVCPIDEELFSENSDYL
ncbi:hypothetical protein [Olsenella profusa]|uniref:Uncharacterized protein n=1 Tax=Olsenella profusa TaxID=138595 RepID=A0ABS2F3D8_9ACTN|nr:hypothetical protein [Olsenella profusa]MBM6775053.1 hypothetical protein [Olsenella profusa]